RSRQSAGDDMAQTKRGQQQHRSRPEYRPADLPFAFAKRGQRIYADLVRRRIRRAFVDLFEKQQEGRAADLMTEAAVFTFVSRNRTRDFLRERNALGRRYRIEMQLTVEPETTPDLRITTVVQEFSRFESQHDHRNGFAGLH